jgi:hypothetical protein
MAGAIVELRISMKRGIKNADFRNFLLQATKYFRDVLYPVLRSMAHASSPEENLVPIQKACIVHNGKLRPLHKYIHHMRQSDST